jgi:flagellar biosynthesis protein FlhB
MNLDKIFEFFQNNPILNIVFLILAVIGVLATIYFYFKSVRKKEPTFSIRSINLVKDKINKIKGLEIIFQKSHFTITEKRL